MTLTSVFSVWRFPDQWGAQRAVHSLAWLSGDRVRIDDAFVVSWPDDRDRPLAWQADDLAGRRPFTGAFWGLLLGLLILVPLTDQGRQLGGGLDLVGDAPAPIGLGPLGFEARFVTAVTQGIGPGFSALFVVDSTTNPECLTRAMPTAALEIARQTMTADQMVSLHAGFDC